MQQTQPPDDRTFVESIDVPLVQVEVVVTDRQGQRVPGLQREDLRLLVDGQEAPVDLFTEIRERQVYGLDGAATVDGGNGLLCFIDDYFTIAGGRGLGRVPQDVTKRASSSASPDSRRFFSKRKPSFSSRPMEAPLSGVVMARMWPRPRTDLP